MSQALQPQAQVPMQAQVKPTSYTMSIAKSLTIDEMRELHQRALSEAEAKKTELKLVLASRYRELVGSSDEVLDMQRDAKVLDELITGIPRLVDRLVACSLGGIAEEEGEEEENDGMELGGETKIDHDDRDIENEADANAASLLADRLQLAEAPRTIHSCLDDDDVHGAAMALLQTFRVITNHTHQYPLANAMAKVESVGRDRQYIPTSNPLLQTQIKMIYLHLQTLPLRIIQMSKKMLLQPSTSTNSTHSEESDEVWSAGLVCASASGAARALSALHLLNVKQIPESQHGNKLMDLYFESKAKLIHNLLDQLTSTVTRTRTGEQQREKEREQQFYTEETTDKAEKIISEILAILQYDVILHPYQIFFLRDLSSSSLLSTFSESVMDSLPHFDREQLKVKMSNFLAAHLPMIRSKVKTILVGIAGTTASRLGQIRQSLYDKTDGLECLSALSNVGCSWDDAIMAIDVKVVMRALEGFTTNENVNTAASSSSTTSATSSLSKSQQRQRRFSLWGTLFSNTFSSLVHSILSTSFHSVHRQVVATLRASLANAPPFREILPHEAYRNTLHIATELDKALKKVSDDAHELLVHAEEREESERRLRQSLYVQTCEIMGRLLNELRRMLKTTSASKSGSPIGMSMSMDSANADDRVDADEEATKELIVGRLCFLLKFRLSTLPTLLDPNSSPAVIPSKSSGKVGMITVAELQSAFDIADDDDDGLISFEEAMEAMEGAFSGTQFHGTEMVRDTMLLSSGSDSIDVKSSASRSLTMSELTLLSARGLRHAASGADSALGVIQTILDGIIETCFSEWAHLALAPSLKTCSASLQQFMATASSVSDNEWKRLHLLGSSSDSEDDHLQKEIGDMLGEESDGSINQDPVSPPELGSVSSFLVAYFISASTVLNQSLTPSDSMALSFPSTGHESSLNMASNGGEITLVKLLQTCLLRESLKSLTKCLHQIITGDEFDESEEAVVLSKCGVSSLAQLLLNVSFVLTCYFERNQFNLDERNVVNREHEEFDEEDESINIVAQSETLLKDMKGEICSILKESNDFQLNNYESLIEKRKELVFSSCGIYFTTLFGEEDNIRNKASITQPVDAFAIPSDDIVPLLEAPLASSRRFMLLPIQAEQSVKELELIKNLERERSRKAEAEKVSSTSAAANAVSSSFGFFSSMLKKQ